MPSTKKIGDVLMSMRLIPKQGVERHLRVKETAQETTFQSVKGGVHRAACHVFAHGSDALRDPLSSSGRCDASHLEGILHRSGTRRLLRSGCTHEEVVRRQCEGHLFLWLPVPHMATPHHTTATHHTTHHTTHTTPHTTPHHTTPHHTTTQHNTTQHNTTQHNTTQHNTTQHNTTQHNILAQAILAQGSSVRVGFLQCQPMLSGRLCRATGSTVSSHWTCRQCNDPWNWSLDELVLRTS